MNTTIWTISDLLFQIRHLKDEVSAFKSGEKYRRMEERCREEIAYVERRNRALTQELLSARKETERVRSRFMEVCEDVRAECEKEKASMQKELDRMEQKMREAFRQRDEALDKLREQKAAVYQAKGELEEVKEKNEALTARIRKDYTNSSKPSSMDPNHKKIANSREPSGKKPGGQPGHKHHPRKLHPVNESHEIEPLPEYADPSHFRPTGNIVRKQMVFFRVVPYVVEYHTSEYRDLRTRKTIHAPFPAGYVNEVNYDSSVKGFAYMLNVGCNVSIDRVRTFMLDVSGGTVGPSTGMICNLSREFTKKTEAERNELFLKHLGADILHADFSFARKQGKQSAVMITATEDSVLYQAKAKKGNDGVKDTPVECYNGTLVSDHESAIAGHGKRHQECVSHVLRYVIASIENERKMEWNRKMRRWLRRAVSHWHAYSEDTAAAWTDMSDKLITQLKVILLIAKREYEYIPPTKYFRDGFNLCKRMSASFEDYVLFLRDHSVPPTNNLAERCARKYKRKTHQMMSFRGDHGDEYLCNGLSVIETLRLQNKSVFNGLVERFAPL